MPDDKPAYLIIDTESVPDGTLLSRVKYPADNLEPAAAIDRAQKEALEANGSDFLPVTFQYPVAVCVLRVGADFTLQAATCLDAPQFRPRKIVESFWQGVASYWSRHRGIRLVTFNGRGFDVPLLELAAFRYGLSVLRDHFHGNRRRFDGWHLDLMDWLTNFGACRLNGGLDLLSKLLGKPGKMTVQGDQVYKLHLAGKSQDINDYCLFDTLDTYFVFLRTRVLTGEMTLEQEQQVVAKAHAWLDGKTAELPGLAQYLANWGQWEPWL